MIPSSSEVRPRGSRARCELALAALFHRVAALALAGALAACGGSGGGSAPVAPPPPASPPPAPLPSTPIAAQLSVPTPVGYDADRLAAFNRINEIRLSAGLGMLAQQPLMDQAAQAHADWIIANDSFAHTETAGSAGFTGADWWNRDEVLGYVPLGGEEVMSAGAGAADGVDVLVNTAYHRAAILAFEPVDVGIGWSGQTAGSVSKPLVIDVTRPGTDLTRSFGQAAQTSIDGVAIWPLDGARNVPTRLGLESPNPVPSQDVLTLGTPASVTVDRMKTIAVSSFVLVNGDTGLVVPVSILTTASDSNSLIVHSFAAAIPLAGLDANTNYVASFSGTVVDFPSGASAAVNRTWSFTTGER